MLSPITSVLLFTLAIFSYASHNHTEVGCKHDEVEFNPEFFQIDEDISITEGRRLSSSYPNLRIYPYYEFLNSAPSSYQEYIQKELAPPVIAYFQAALDVKYPIKTLLKLESTTKKICGRDIPNVLSTGVKADYFMIFDSVSDTGSWVAESTNCGLAADTKRPIVSTTLFNRQLFKEADGNVLLHEKNIYLLLHEMTHTFGFSKNLYKYYLDDNGVTRKGHTKELRLSGKTSIVVDVPSLTNRLRSFFGCSSLAGAYMENSGSSATMGSHFERRQFGYEAMTSGLIYQQSYSEFSLAMLEATGWYVANYDYAEPFFFGQGQGCDFLTASCTAKTLNFDDFCTETTRSCTPQGRGGGKCGSDVRSDGCKFVHPNINYDCENEDATKYAKLPEAEVYGRTANSKCFTGSLTTKKSATKTSFCFKYKCVGSGSNLELQVQIGKQALICKEEGPLEVAGYNGVIDCPDPLRFCRTVGESYCPRGCMGRGTCTNGKCVCRKGFKGKDCGMNI